MRVATNIVSDRQGFKADEVLEFAARERVTPLAFCREWLAGLEQPQRLDFVD